MYLMIILLGYIIILVLLKVVAQLHCCSVIYVLRAFCVTAQILLSFFIIFSLQKGEIFNDVIRMKCSISPSESSCAIVPLCRKMQCAIFTELYKTCLSCFMTLLLQKDEI